LDELGHKVIPFVISTSLFLADRCKCVLLAVFRHGGGAGRAGLANALGPGTRRIDKLINTSGCVCATAESAHNAGGHTHKFLTLAE
jgi:hypothetical protein